MQIKIILQIELELIFFSSFLEFSRNLHHTSLFTAFSSIFILNIILFILIFHSKDLLILSKSPDGLELLSIQHVLSNSTKSNEFFCNLDVEKDEYDWQLTIIDILISQLVPIYIRKSAVYHSWIQNIKNSFPLTSWSSYSIDATIKTDINFSIPLVRLFLK